MLYRKKGERIVSLDLKKIPEAVTDFFIICEASNPIQLKAIADFVEEEVKKKCGETPYKHEGRQGEQWILIENVIKGSLWQWAIIGTGLNINQQEFDELNLKATSLKLVTGKSYDVLNLTKELIILILKRIEELKSGKYEKLLDEYNQHLFGRNKMVKLKKGNIVFETKICAVSSSGQLITKDAIERRFNFDEVEFKGISERDPA